MPKEDLDLVSKALFVNLPAHFMYDIHVHLILISPFNLFAFLQPNHLVGLKQKYVKLSFMNVNDLMKVRKDVLPAVKKNWERQKSNTAYAEMLRQSYIGDVGEFEAQKSSTDHMENIIDIR